MLTENSSRLSAKTVTENTGEQIKTDLLVGLSEMFQKTLQSADATTDSGIYTLTLSKSPDLCGNLHLALQNALVSSSLPLSTEDFTLSFAAKPEWDDVKTAEIVVRDLEAQSHRWFGARFGSKMLGLVLRPHKPNNLSQKIVSTLKEAADQCSGARPSLLWLHLIGHREEEFLKVAEFSQKGDGAGLNVIVARVLHPRASQTDRSHVYKIRFSAEAATLTQKPILDAQRLIQRANSLNGLCYDVPNPLCRYSFDVDV
jgi:hypothetical protein